MAPVRPTRHEQANKFSADVCPVQGHGCESGARAKPPSRSVGGGLTLSRKRAQKSVLAPGRLISFGFRKKRHQADSRDAPLTSTPTTTISATGGRAFLLPSTSTPFGCQLFAERTRILDILSATTVVAISARAIFLRSGRCRAFGDLRINRNVVMVAQTSAVFLP